MVLVFYYLLLLLYYKLTYRPLVRLKKCQTLRVESEQVQICPTAVEKYQEI